MSVPTPPGPAAVTIADFNGDGIPDLASSNQAANSVSVFLGGASGGFGAGVAYPVGEAPTGIATADFNEDGRVDIAVADFGTLGSPTTTDLSVLLNTGSGFAPAQHLSLGVPESHAYSIATADFNRDGHADIALGNYGLRAVSVFLGSGTGSFSLAGTFPMTFPNTFSIAIGDFNHDSNPDVAATIDFVHGVAILMGNGTGTLGTPTLFPAGILPIGVGVGDLDKDGNLDLAVVGVSLSVLRGDGLGGFGPFTSFPVGTFPRGVGLADFDLDGKLDVAVTNSGSDSVSVLLGDGLGGFGSSTEVPVGANPLGIAVGDVDLDGLPDIVSANSLSNTLSVLVNAAPTVLPASLPFGVVSGTYPTTQFSASGGTAPYTFALSGTPPPGLTFNAATATLSGMPAQLGTSTFSITVTDAAGCSSTRAYSVTVGQALSIVELTSSANPSVLGQVIRLTATVFPNNPTRPTGTVQFKEGPVIFGTAPLVDGVATLDISSFTLGTHIITAQYLGDANFGPNITSTLVFQVVVAAEVPTLGEIGRGVFLLLLAAAGYAVIRFRT